jgi:hypothetical protein
MLFSWIWLFWRPKHPVAPNFVRWLQFGIFLSYLPCVDIATGAPFWAPLDIGHHERKFHIQFQHDDLLSSSIDCPSTVPGQSAS